MIEDSPILPQIEDSFQLIDFSFPHISPEGYHYELERSRYKNIIGICLRHDYSYVFTDRCVRTIWGFYHTRQRCYYSPINSTTKGNQVELARTTPYSAMVPNLNPLEIALYGGV